MSKGETTTETTTNSKPAAIVTRDQLLSANKRRFKQFPVPGLPGEVRIRSLTEREKANYEARFMDKGGNLSRDRLKEARRVLVMLIVVDAEGNPILNDGDVKTLEEIDGNITSTIQAEGQIHCGITRAQVEEETKN